MKVLTLAKLLIDNSIQSWHIFRKLRLKRVYTLLRNYHIQKLIWILILKLIIGKKVKLIVDGTILDVAKVSRARTQRIRRVGSRLCWVKRYFVGHLRFMVIRVIGDVMGCWCVKGRRVRQGGK